MNTHALAPYRAVFSSRVREELQYRAAAAAGLFTQVVFGFILIMVLLAFYSSSDVVSPLGVLDTVAYIWLAQALLGCPRQSPNWRERRHLNPSRIEVTHE